MSHNNNLEVPSQEGGSKGKERRNSNNNNNNNNSNENELPSSSANNNTISRRLTRTSLPTSIPSESDPDSDDDGSDNSTDTEEDVWFPMDPENNRSHHGIDFEELQQFIDGQREETRSLLKDNVNAIGESTDYAKFAGIINNNENNERRRKHRLRKQKKKLSKAALKYVPKWLQHQETNVINKEDYDDNYSLDELRVGSNENDSTSSSSNNKLFKQKTNQVDFNAKLNKVEEDENDTESKATNINNNTIDIPDRFALFTSASEHTIHAYDLPSLLGPNQSIKDLFDTENENFVWWLDCCCATDNEIKILAKAFGIHPLTTEDIRMSENREKVEFFKDYYFITFHSFDSDNESEEFLEPINFYMVVFRSGILTFHSTPLIHCINVRRRIRQLKEYIPLSSDWICYALIDNITDSFFPVINAIDYETDAIEAAVFVIRDVDFSTMLRRIGDARRKVMTLIRLLSGKADVLRMLYKRCHDHITDTNNNNMNFNGNPELPENKTFSNLVALNNAIIAATPPTDSQHNLNEISRTKELPNKSETSSSNKNHNGETTISPRSEIALFLGDIQDHIITLNMNLSSYEKILSRSYTNYLAQLQVESFNSNNRVTDILSKVTIIGTLLVPLNLVGSLFGMNVKVPGQDNDNLAWWFGILGVMIFLAVFGWIAANRWINYASNDNNSNEESLDDSRTLISRLFTRGRQITRNGGMVRDNNNAQSIVSFPNN